MLKRNKFDPDGTCGRDSCCQRRSRRVDWISSGRLAAVIAALATCTAAFAASAAYTYDALGRLTKVVYSDGTKTSTITYTYDAAGNRTSVANTSPS